MNQKSSGPNETTPPKTPETAETAQAATTAAARAVLIGELMASIQADVQAVSQAAARLLDTPAAGAGTVATDWAKVQGWLNDANRLAGLVCDVNHPHLKGLAAELDELSNGVYEQLHGRG